MRSLFWFFPAITIPLVCLHLSSRQPPSTATVDIQEKPLPPSTLLSQTTTVTPKVSASHPPTSAKKPPQKVIAQKHPPKAKARRKKNKTTARPYTAPAIELRVAVAQNVSSLAIAFSTDANITDGNRQSLESLSPGQSFQISASSSTILFQNWQIPSALWIEPTDGGAIFVGNDWYRGKLLLIAQGNKLLAINYVDLEQYLLSVEQYLLSVVGSEMSAAAPMEALKAQAVAARSYALVHTFRNVNEPFDVTSGERHQAYKGIATEYNTTHQAVSETAGEILSYQGGVVESLYAATQAIVDKAHEGAGMSQNGAYTYANQGYDYQQILGVYYPGVNISRLEAKK